LGLFWTIASNGQSNSAVTSPAAPAISASSVPTQLISAEDFGALPFMFNPKLSPDGMRVLTSAVVKEQERVVVLDLKDKTAVSHSIVIPDNFDLNWYRWAGNDRVLMGIGQTAKFFGDDVYVTRLMMYDLATQKPAFIGKRSEGIEGDDVIHVDREGRFLLLNIQETIYEYPSVWRVELDTLAMKEVVKQHDNVWNWFADGTGTVRAGIGGVGKSWWLLYRRDPSGKFEKVLKRKVTKADESTDIERFVPINGTDSGYAVANKNTGRYGLYRYDFGTDTLGEAVFEHAKVDMDDFSLAADGGIEAVFYTDDRARIEWINPKMKVIQEDIDRALPDRINRVTSISRDGSRMVIWTGSSSDPGRYYVYQVNAGVMSIFSRPYERIVGKKLAPMESTAYRARDGLEIPAYLTLPIDRASKALPLILMPHGGPFIRDSWGYDVYAQFLANRGYAVLQPNFRGSTGYGREFVEQGMGQWGRAMQDDLDDGVQWLVDQGKVDPKRICIMGASYGGYAAMWAAVRNPEIYRCAISFAGISDVNAMLKYDRKTFAAPRYFRNWRERVQGDKNFDLNSVSPLRAVDRVRIPLLIAHGEKDDNVPMSQSQKLHEALTKAGKPHEYVIYQGERHGFQKVGNAVDYLKRVEAFLAKYNPAE
jgi:dipeptidyl aminopeptidase/acylaminoacyl peptidase